MPDNVRVRFPPSPTGYLHVGGLRTALFNWLFARHHGGVFILRIEDTDRARFQEDSLSDILESLRWLGLDWDEGPEVGGEHGPYFQSERLDIYHDHARKLVEGGHAYYCFCTPERLEEVRKEQMARGDQPGYDRLCRGIPPEEAQRRVDAGEQHVVRLKVPIEGETGFVDLIRGPITVENRMQDDLVLVKSDGYPTYHLANVVDDKLMGVTHIFRGDEWIPTAPRHKILYEAFGWQMPQIAHMPVILDPGGKGKMSKRKSSDMPVSVREFVEAGYLPEAMFNFLALIGWSYDDKTEIMSRDELIERFDIAHVNPAAAVFNYEKLQDMNGHYIRSLAVEDLTDRLMPFLERAGVQADRETMLKVTPLIRERIKKLDEAAEWVDFFFEEKAIAYDDRLLLPKNTTAYETMTNLSESRATLTELDDFSHEAIEAALRKAAEGAGVKLGQFLAPIRVAVCGKTVAPPLFETLEILGRETALFRLDRAIAKLAFLVMEENHVDKVKAKD